MARRDALKALGAGVLAASGAWVLGRDAGAATPELRYAPEKGAQLRFLRWKRFVQGDEDQWLANTRKFTEQTGVPVQIESVSLEDLPSKAAMAANVGAGPDIVMGSYGQPQLYPDKCLDLTELANYLGDKYGGWYDAVKAYCMTDGRWIALGHGLSDQLRGLSREHGQGGGLQRDPARPRRLPEAVPRIECPWHATRIRARQCHRRRHHMVPLARVVARRKTGRRERSGRDQLQGDHRRARVCQGAVSDPGPRHAVVARSEQQQGVPRGPDQPHLQRHLDLLRREDFLRPGPQSDRSRHAACALPVGPVGRPTELSPFAPAWVFNYTRYPNAAREYLRFMLEREQYEAWQRASLGYFAQSLRSHESDPIWTEDPKYTPFRDGPA